MGSHTNRASPPESAEAKEILDAVRQIVRALRESSRSAERQVGISGAQLFVLEKLADGHALSLNELAERTLTHQSSVSVVVARLRAAGMVRTVRSKDDGRRLEIALTERGRERLRGAPEAAQERLIRGIVRLSQADRAALARGLRRLVRAMDITELGPTMFFEEVVKAKRGSRNGRS
jgi:DNA-binding MarR family transcriptional regulator